MAIHFNWGLSESDSGKGGWENDETNENMHFHVQINLRIMQTKGDGCSLLCADMLFSSDILTLFSLFLPLFLFLVLNERELGLSFFFFSSFYFWNFHGFDATGKTNKGNPREGKWKTL